MSESPLDLCLRCGCTRRKHFGCRNGYTCRGECPPDPTHWCMDHQCKCTEFIASPIPGLRDALAKLDESMRMAIWPALLDALSDYCIHCGSSTVGKINGCRCQDDS